MELIDLVNSVVIFLSQTTLPRWKILIIMLSQFPLTFHQTENGMPHFIAYLMTYSCADWDGLCDYLGDIPWEDIFKLSACAAAGEFCEWVQVGIDMYIPASHCMYKVKSDSSQDFQILVLQR